MEQFIPYFDTILKVGVITFGAFGFYYAIRNDISSLKVSIEHIKENQKSLQEAFSQLGSILTKVAVQDTRLSMIEKKLDELSHGQGYVKIQGNI